MRPKPTTRQRLPLSVMGRLGGRDGVARRQGGRARVIGEHDGVLREGLRRSLERPAEDERPRREAFQHGNERNGARIGADPVLLCQCGHRQRGGVLARERRVQPGAAVRQAWHLIRLDAEAARHQALGEVPLACVAAEHGDRFEHGHPSFLRYSMPEARAVRRCGGKKRPRPAGQGKDGTYIYYI